MDQRSDGSHPSTSDIAAVAEEAAALFPCAICGHRGRGEAFVHHLTHGLQIWLCRTHGATEFLQRRSGLEFVERLAGVWAACGSLTRRKVAALRTHIERIRAANDGRKRPGSYSWPALRDEAERRFASGEAPNLVIDDLRARHSADTAVAPSVRTMRRWFNQRRWLALQPPRRGYREPLTGRPDDHKPPPHPLIRLVLTGVAYPYQPPPVRRW